MVQLAVIWVLMGLAVSDRSFAFLTGQVLRRFDGASVATVVFNGFFGILVPASSLLVMLLLSRSHLRWMFFRGPGLRGR